MMTRMYMTLGVLLPAVGCLERDISRYIEDIGECTETTTGSSSSSGDVSTSSESGDASTSSSTSTGDTTGETSTSGPDDTGTSDPSSSTGEPVAVCGNGVIEAFGPDPEDCDDANDNPYDGCRECGRDRLVFVTSETYQGGVFKGLDGADQRCRSLAAQAGLPNFAGFKAWLSDSKTSARDRMWHARGRYVLVNGLVVADSWDALVTGPLQNPINATELSESFDSFVWTGTRPDGSAVPDADHCDDWTKNIDVRAFTGNSEAVVDEWTYIPERIELPAGCATNLGLYCFEQE